jgi:hypothetical protein
VFLPQGFRLAIFTSTGAHLQRGSKSLSPCSLLCWDLG